MSSNKHGKHKRHASQKRHSSSHSHVSMTDTNIHSRLGLNINLTARPIQSLAKYTRKAQSKPAINSIDMTAKHFNPYNQPRHSFSHSKSKRSRFQKRISSPIILPTSTTHSLSSSLNATAKLPKNIGTPYYTNANPSLMLDDENPFDDKEINEMIKSTTRRLSKISRPRAYSKTRKMSSINLSEYTESMESDNSSDSSAEEGKHDYHHTLRKYGYSEVCVIAKSLQGIVIKAKPMLQNKNSEHQTVIIKITDRSLHSKRISNKHGKTLSVEEDIIKEKKLLMYLTANNSPKELVKFLGFFSDKYNYYLVMENGGTDFFDWIVKCHKWIRDGKLSIKQWNLYIHDLMAQIVSFLKWLHTRMNVCHLDISLENLLINNNKYKSDGFGGIRLSRKMQVKVCDFGLAEYFQKNQFGTPTGNVFACKKYVGKTHYKAPKVYGKREVFDARKADIWSLGVSFFMMAIGAPPYKLPLSSDDHFPFIQRGNVMGILKKWNRAHYITSKHTLHLLNQMLQVSEHKRFDIAQIEKHLLFVFEIPKRISHSNKRKKYLKKHKHKKVTNPKPSNPVSIHSNIMASYGGNGALMESDTPKRARANTCQTRTNNIFQHLVMAGDDGQLFRYRKRKLTST